MNSTRHTAILFDIDGTIMNCHGAGKESLQRATREVFGTCGKMETAEFQGRTDINILHESLLPAGFSVKDINQGLAQLKETYFGHLSRLIHQYDTVLLPGIRDLLTRLADANSFIVGLLTGNFEQGARIKLGKYGLNDFFSFGIFADDTPVRNEMPGIGQEKIRNKFGITLHADDLYIIGDTIYDIECAKKSGARAIAVGTGWTDRQTLLDRKPDYYFENLGNTAPILEIFRRTTCK